VLVNKYADHLPLYRRSQIFERDGLDLGRSTLADWGEARSRSERAVRRTDRRVERAKRRMANRRPCRSRWPTPSGGTCQPDRRSSRTTPPLQMLAPGAGKTATARLRAYGRDERPSHPRRAFGATDGDAPPASWYRFSADRKGRRPKDHLAKYRGWRHADGYAGFNELYRAGGIREVACMAHVRRKFVDAPRAQGSAIADEAIERIARLYAIEKEARGSPPDGRVGVVDAADPQTAAACDVDLDRACCGIEIGGPSWIFVLGQIKYLDRQETDGIWRDRRDA
jgi:transposase